MFITKKILYQALFFSPLPPNGKKQQELAGNQKKKMNPDSPENRSYIQKTRLWLLGEVVVMKLLLEKPTKVYDAILDVLEKEKSKQTEVVDAPPADVAADSKSYILENKIATLVEEWYASVLEVKPENPLDYSISYFGKVRGEKDGTAAAEGSVAE